MCFSGWHASTAPYCFLSGHPSMAIAVETPGPGYETHSDEGKERQQCNQQSLTGDTPSDLHQIQSQRQNQVPLNLSYPNSPPCFHPWPCWGPDPSHHFLFAWPPPPHTLTLAFLLTPRQSLWTPFQSFSSFASWLGLDLAPDLFFVVPSTLLTHLRPEVLNNRPFFREEVSWSNSSTYQEVHWL